MKIVMLDSDTVSPEENDFKRFHELGDLVSYTFTKNEDVAERIGDAEIVFCTKSEITDEVFQKCKNLKYIGLFSTGYNNVDIQSATKHNVIVCNVPDYSSDAVAQYAFALILHYCSKVSDYASTVENGDWIKSRLFTYFSIPIYELSDLTLGIIGYGSIGKKVAEIARAFGMKVIVDTRTIPNVSNNISFVSLDELLEKSDIVSIHCPLNDETKELINAKTLSKMKNTALLVNTSRGGIINENDLAYALNNGIISAAGLDVLAVEPMLENNPLRKAKNCYITPHVAWSPYTARQRLLKLTIDNFNAWKKNSPINIVNWEV